jgi:mannitol/fructose-specific phosphotransferase system IIA component (Ntr-type)
MIIGAYIMGLTLSKTDLTYLLQTNLSVFYRFFVPIFFCVMGMLIDIRAILDVKILVFALIYTFLAIGAKMAGCCVPALLLNFNLRGAARIGVGMVPRGEVALIIGGIGLSSGILSTDAFSIAVIMTILTTLIAPPIFAGMIENDRPVMKKHARIKADTMQHIAYEFPNRETAELLLTKIIDAFKNEGYFVHILDIRRRLYGVRKEDSFITMHFSPEKIVFDCRKNDVPFIHTLFYEALAHLQRTMRQLQNLTDRKEIGKMIFQDPAKKIPRINGKKKSLLFRFFSPGGVEFNLPGKDKEAVLSEMVELFVESGALRPADRDQALSLIVARENDISTGLQHGIAFPHARTNLVKKMRTVVGISKNGVDFNSLDNNPAYVIISTLIPLDQPEPYLTMMANLSRILSVKENREHLIDCQSNRELYNTFLSMI